MKESPNAAPLPESSRGRFVTQFHRWDRGDHFDVMLETGERLSTWRSTRRLGEVDAEPTVLERTADHRAAYLTYEGAVSGNRGTVAIVERGGFELRRQRDGVYLLKIWPDAAADPRNGAHGADGARVFELVASGGSWSIRRVDGGYPE